MENDNDRQEEYNILIVDDDKAIRESFQEILSLIGAYHVETAEDPFDGLEKLEKKEFDIVVSDIRMPKMDGVEFLKKIKEKDPTLPVVMITGFPTVDIAIQAMKEGASDFITKPFRYDEVKVIAEKLIRERKILKENAQFHDVLRQKQTIESLNKKLNEKIKEISVLYSISEAFSGSHMDGDCIYEKIVQMASEVTGASFSMLMLVDTEKKEIVPKATYGIKGDFSSPRFSHYKGLYGRIIQKKVPFIVQNTYINPLAIGINDKNFLCSAILLLPLTIKEAIFAILIVGDTQNKKIFNQEDIAILQNLTGKATLTIENKLLYESIYDNLKDTLHSLISAIEARDQYTLKHSIRVTKLSIEIAKVMGCSQEEQDILNFAGYLHDIGKIGISDSILLKPGRLSKEEYEIIKTHPDIGTNILEPLGLLPLEKSIIRHHHERWDGKGYPNGLSGEEIPLLSRILAVADTYDAMTTDRPYRRALIKRDAVIAMQKCVNLQFDKNVMDAFLEIMASVFTIHSSHFFDSP